MIASAGGRLAERHRNRLGVSVLHRHARRRRADRHRMRLDALVAVAAENLPGLRLDLVLLAVDERNHVAENVPRRDARIAGAGDRLERRDHDALQAERPKRRERHRQHDGRTVRVRDDAALPAAGRRLRLEQRQMIGVDLRNEQRHVGFHPVVLRVADDEVARLRRTRLRSRRRPTNRARRTPASARGPASPRRRPDARRRRAAATGRRHAAASW